MKLVKLTKKMLKLAPSEFLIEIGAVDMEMKKAFPDYVYMSKEDLQTQKKNLVKLVNKNHKDMTKHYRQNVVGLETLNYSPAELLKDALKKGYCLVDFSGIDLAKKAEK